MGAVEVAEKAWRAVISAGERLVNVSAVILSRARVGVGQDAGGKLGPEVYYAAAATLIVLSLAALFSASLLSGNEGTKKRGSQISAVKEEIVLRDITPEELAEHDGSDPNKPVWVAIRGNVFDVTRGATFYGAGGPYSSFAGKDASIALAKMSFAEEHLSSVPPNLEGLSYSEREVLDDWELKFNLKYDKLGPLVVAS